MKSFNSGSRILGVTLSISLILSTTAWAEFNPQRTPPIGGPITSGGNRGCSLDVPVSFAALAPVSTIAELTLDHPTVAWYSPDRKVYKIGFILYEADPTSSTGWKLLKEFEKQDSQFGIQRFTLPLELLKEGQTYTWQAVLECRPGEPSGDLIAEAQFKVVSISFEVKKQLSQASTPEARAKRYADTGLWYSAFAEASNSRPTQIDLLRQLVKYEKTQQSPDLKVQQHGRKRGEILDKIVVALSQN